MLEARVAADAGSTAAVTAPPAATPATDSEDSLDRILQLTGVLNELVLSYDDGQDSGAYQATNDAFTTRLVIRASSEITEDWSGGFWAHDFIELINK